MFVYKKTEELEKLTPLELDQYKADLQAHEAQIRKNEIDAEVKKQVETAKTALKTELEDEIAKQLIDTKKTVSNDENAIEKEVSEKLETLKSIASGNRGEVEIKALTNRASISGNTNAYVLPDIGQLGVKRRSLYDVLPKIQISDRSNDNGIIKYHDWDEDTTVRAAAMVAEGGTFQESTAKFIERTLPIRKIGDSLPVTEEFGEDATMAAAELSMFLEVNVNTVVDSQIINGDNTGQNLKGLLTSVPAFTPVASSIPSANIYDLCRKVRTDIVKNRGSKYQPDIVVANSDTLDRYHLTKDLNDNYLFRMELGDRIGALTIIEDNNMPDNQLVVGDRRFARIYEKAGLVISEALVNAQFLSDAKTIKARKRLAMLIRTVDATGFRKVTNITTALATLESTP